MTEVLKHIFSLMSSKPRERHRSASAKDIFAQEGWWDELDGIPTDFRRALGPGSQTQPPRYRRGSGNVILLEVSPGHAPLSAQFRREISSRASERLRSLDESFELKKMAMQIRQEMACR